MKHWDGYPGRLVTECREKWFYEFDFLKRIPSYHAYLTILGVAKSANHLEKLHEMMPDDTRFLRADWEKVASFWKYFFAGPETKKYRKELERWLLEEHFADWRNEGHGHAGLFPALNATNYYTQVIKSHASKTPLTYFSSYCGGKWTFNESRRVLSSLDRIGNGTNHFQTRLFGKLIDTAFHLHKSSAVHVLVWFMFRETQLTEPLTHKIISQLPNYCVLRYRIPQSSSTEGEFIHVAFELKASWLWNHADSFRGEFVARESFLTVGAELLRENGIPAEGSLLPIRIEYAPTREDE